MTRCALRPSRSTGRSGRLCAAVVTVVAVGVGTTTAPRAGPTIGAEWADRAPQYVLYSVGEDGRGRRVLQTVAPALLGADGAGRVVSRSPDGNQLLVAGPEGLVLADFDGSHAVRLSLPGEQAWPDAAFSRDGRYVAFSASSPEPSCGQFSFTCRRLYVVRRDGTGLRRLSDNGLLPSWSADGRWIAFVGELDQNGGPGAVFVVRRDGTRLRRLIGSRGYSSLGPAFSPAGDELAYRCGDAGDLCIVQAIGSGLRRFADAHAFALLWSPDAKSIVFERGANGINHAVLGVVSVASGALRSLTDSRTNGTDDTPLAWSPDRSRIAFQRTCELGKAYCRTAVYSLRVADGNKRRLSRDDRLWFDVRWANHRLSYLVLER